MIDAPVIEKMAPFFDNRILSQVSGLSDPVASFQRLSKVNPVKWIHTNSSAKNDARQAGGSRASGSTFTNFFPSTPKTGSGGSYTWQAPLEPQIKACPWATVLAVGNTSNWQAISVSQPKSDLLKETATPASILGLAVSALVERTRRNAKFEDVDASTIADRATTEASAFVETENLPLPHRAMFSDEGLLTLQWRGEKRGVAMFFAGDGNATLSFKGPGYGYAEVGIDVTVTDRLPQDFWLLLSKVNS